MESSLRMNVWEPVTEAPKGTVKRKTTKGAVSSLLGAYSRFQLQHADAYQVATAALTTEHTEYADEMARQSVCSV